MKHMMMILSLTILSTAAFAAPKHIALCEIQQAEEDIKTPDLVYITDTNIKDVESVTAYQTVLLNRYLRHQEYTTQDSSFAEIKQMFSDNGEHQFDELHILTFQAKSTGNVYTQVHSYPGDNQYGLIYDIQGQLVASIGDGDVSILEGNKSLNCYDLVP